MSKEKELKEFAKKVVDSNLRKFIVNEIASLDLDRIKAKRTINEIENEIGFAREEFRNMKKPVLDVTPELIASIKLKSEELRDLKAKLAPWVKEQIIRKRKIGYLRTIQFKFVPKENFNPNAKLKEAADKYKNSKNK